MKKLFTLFAIAVIAVVFTGCDKPAEITEPTYTSYTDQDNFYKIEVPENWNLKEEHEETTQFWSRVHITPQGYTDDTFPYLISVSVSNFNFDMSVTTYELTNTILEKEDIDYNGRKAVRLKLQNNNDGTISNAYILEYLSGQSIVFHLRSNNPQYVAVLKHIWESFDSLR